MLYAAWYATGLFGCWLWRESLRSGFRANGWDYDRAAPKTVIGFGLFSALGPIMLLLDAVGWACALVEWAPWRKTGWHKKTKEFLNRPLLKD